jgi:type 1 fimbria pilin
MKKMMLLVTCMATVAVTHAAPASDRNHLDIKGFNNVKSTNSIKS